MSVRDDNSTITADSPIDVLIIGTGPSGVAVAERLYQKCPTAAIALVERGPLLLRRHFYDFGGSIQLRDAFVRRHLDCPWDGDLSRGGGILPALGGRGIVGGTQLHRFYERDLTAWPEGAWPLRPTEIDRYLGEAEKRLLTANQSQSRGPAQEYACAALADFGARHPPRGDALRSASRPNTGYPHRSSAERLLALVEQDRRAGSKRLSVDTDTRALQLITQPSDAELITSVACWRDSQTKPLLVDVTASIVVLAAGAVESARLVLVSELSAERPSTPSAVGHYLAEHIYARGTFRVSSRSELSSGPINLFIPPHGDELRARFQLEIRTMASSVRDLALLRVSGSAAMDPRHENRVTLSPKAVDDMGVPRAHTELTPSRQDEVRTASMMESMKQVAAHLGGQWTTRPTVLPTGASFHEVGTLRIGRPGQDRAADIDGRLLGTRNVFVGDGAAFPSVGVANPILTLTAMGYRLADHLAEVLGVC